MRHRFTRTGLGFLFGSAVYYVTSIALFHAANGSGLLWRAVLFGAIISVPWGVAAALRRRP